MLIKIILSLMIISCTSILGIIYSNSYIERSKFLANMLLTLQMLETEIVYSATPLPELFKKVAKKSKKDIASILLLTAEILDKKEGHLFHDVWKEAVETKTDKSYLTKEDKNLLVSLGSNLGISDSKDQVKYIRLAMEEIKRNYELSLIDQNKNVRLYRNFGILIGITIVIIFF